MFVLEVRTNSPVRTNGALLEHYILLHEAGISNSMCNLVVGYFSRTTHTHTHKRSFDSQAPVLAPHHDHRSGPVSRMIRDLDLSLDVERN